MPIQAPHWTDYLNCPVCFREYGLSPRSPVSLGCGHTLCEHCLKQLNRKNCPFDQTIIQGDPEELPVNTALLQLAGYSPPLKRVHPPCIQSLPEIDRYSYDVIVTCLEQLAAYLKICANNTAGNRLSRPMQRKLVILLQCAITDEEGRCRAARAARSLGERSVTELILQHQNPQQLGANLWAAVRARGCQFLGPGMQEEVLKLVLLALEDGSSLSRKVLVMFVVQRLERAYPQASKTSIGHVVQLLYRASCFKVSKRECDSSLMQLKEEFRTYETLRREHDAQIVQIATEAGLRIAPDQWSSLLYGDISHKSHMQSIIDKLQTPQSFAQSVQELFIALQRSGDPCQSVVMSLPLGRLANIDPSLDANCPSWQALADIVMAVRDVVSGLVSYLQHQAAARDTNYNKKHISQEKPDINASQTSPPSPPQRFKMFSCRDSDLRSGCPRGSGCTFTHFDDAEMDRYKAIPPGYINNGQMISYPPITSMHVASASNSPPFAMSNQSQYHSILQQRPLQGLHLQQMDGFNASPNMHGLLPPAPMLRRQDVPSGPVNYERNGDSLTQSLPNRNDMGGNIGVPPNASLPDLNTSHVPLYAHGPATPGGAYGPGLIMNSTTISHNNIMMPVPESSFYRRYPGVLGVVAGGSPNNFYTGSEAINYTQYQTPSLAPTSHPFMAVQQESSYAFDANPDIYPIAQVPNPTGPMPEYQVSQDSNYVYNNITSMPAEYREPPGFPPMPREPRPDGPSAPFYWHRSSNFEPENYTEALSRRSPLFNVLNPTVMENMRIPSDRRAVGADRGLVAERPAVGVDRGLVAERPAVGVDRNLVAERPPLQAVVPVIDADENTLEEEMIALERRINTEFKIF